MKTITTKTLYPTNFQGQRIKATAPGVKAIVLAFNYEASHDQNHQIAARALAEKYNWSGTWLCGDIDEGGKKVWVCDSQFTRRFEVPKNGN